MLPGDTLQDTVDALSTAMALGLTVPVIPGMQGWVLTVDTWDDEDSAYFRCHTSIHPNEDSAYAALARWAISEWQRYDSEFWTMLEEEKFLPLKRHSDEVIVQKHFSSHWNRDNYDLALCRVSTRKHT